MITSKYTSDDRKYGRHRCSGPRVWLAAATLSAVLLTVATLVINSNKGQTGHSHLLYERPIQSHRQLVGDQKEFYAQLQKLTNLSISEEDGTLSIRGGKYAGDNVGQFIYSIEYREETPCMFIGLIKNKNEYRGQGIFQKLTAMVVKYTDGLEKIKLRASHFEGEMFPHTYYAQKLGFLTDEMSKKDTELWTNGPDGFDFAVTPRGEELEAVSPNNIDKWLQCFRVKQVFSDDGFKPGDTDPEDLETPHMQNLRENFCDDFYEALSDLTAWPCLDMYLDVQEGARPDWLRYHIKKLDEMEKTGASYEFEPRS